MRQDTSPSFSLIKLFSSNALDEAIKSYFLWIINNEIIIIFDIKNEISFELDRA